MTNEEFINNVKTLPEVQKLIEQYDPYIVALGGSRDSGYEIESSDWDLVLIASKPVENSFKTVNLPTAEKCHVFCYSLETLIKIYLDCCEEPVPVVHMIWGGSKNITTPYQIYNKNDPFFEEIRKFFISNSKLITELGTESLLNSMQDSLRNVIFDTTYNYSLKMYYRLLMCYDAIYDDNSSVLIMALRNKKMNDEQKVELKEKMTQLKYFYDNFDYHKHMEQKQHLEVLLWLLRHNQ